MDDSYGSKRTQGPKTYRVPVVFDKDEETRPKLAPLEEGKNISPIHSN